MQRVVTLQRPPRPSRDFPARRLLHQHLPDRVAEARMTAAKPRRAARRFMWCVVAPVVCAAVAIGLLPEVVFRVAYGRGPLRADPAAVVEGMTPDEVTAILGAPHRHDDEDGEAVWTYFQDAFTLNAVSVNFKKTGRVRHWWVR